MYTVRRIIKQVDHSPLHRSPAGMDEDANVAIKSSGPKCPSKEQTPTLVRREALENRTYHIVDDRRGIKAVCGRDGLHRPAVPYRLS